MKTHLDGVDAAAERVRGRERRDHRADVHADHVDEAADRERGERERERVGEPEHDHARAEDADDDEQLPAGPASAAAGASA